MALVEHVVTVLLQWLLLTVRPTTTSCDARPG